MRHRINLVEHALLDTPLNAYLWIASFLVVKPQKKPLASCNSTTKNTNSLYHTLSRNPISEQLPHVSLHE
jgi:hypothetical protein